MKKKPQKKFSPTRWRYARIAAALVAASLMSCGEPELPRHVLLEVAKALVTEIVKQSTR